MALFFHMKIRRNIVLLSVNDVRYAPTLFLNVNAVLVNDEYIELNTTYY